MMTHIHSNTRLACMAGSTKAGGDGACPGDTWHWNDCSPAAQGGVIIVSNLNYQGKQDMKLDSSVAAVITGGASGLGAATARRLASHGVKVALF